jgi:hypothetical protein
MPDVFDHPPARLWRLTVAEPVGVAERNRRREQIVDELASHGLDVVASEPAGRGRVRLSVSARHRIPWHVASVVVRTVPGYVVDTLEGAGA